MSILRKFSADRISRGAGFQRARRSESEARGPRPEPSVGIRALLAGGWWRRWFWICALAAGSCSSNPPGPAPNLLHPDTIEFVQTIQASRILALGENYPLPLDVALGPELFRKIIDRGGTRLRCGQRRIE